MRAKEFTTEAVLDPGGWGETPYGTDIDYFGLRVQMKPSTFLKLALPLGSAETNSEVEKHMRAGGKIAYPMLDIEIPDGWEKNDFSDPGKVVSHEGRNRMKTWIALKGDDPIQVNIKPRGWYRRKHLTPEHVEAISKGLFSQRGNLVNGPLFPTDSALEEGWKNWVAGAAIGAAALGGAHNIYNKANQPTQPTQATQTAQQPAQNDQFNFLGNNPVNELTIVKMAKAAGILGTELAQFLAQTKHESWDFTKMHEKAGSKDYFLKKYDITYNPGMAKKLGNTEAGDGAKYYGRGFIQLTGKENYARASKALNLPLLDKPDLASDPEVAAKIAIWYWNSRVKPHVTDFNDTKAVTKRINPGLSGLQDRHENFQDYMKVI
jgi:predicted chitinase